VTAPYTLLALKNEITTDPQALGYAPRYTAGDDYSLALMINAVTGVGAVQMLVGSLTRGAVLKGIIPGTDQLATGLTLSGAAISSALNAKWINRFAALRGGDAAIQVDSGFMGLVNGLVSDGLMTQAYVDAFTKKTGSRAEVLFGVDTVISIAQVAATRGI
jgi:hypothetical protein